MGEEILYTETTVKDIAYKAFTFMQQKGFIQSLFVYKKEKEGDEPGEKIFSFEYDGNHKLNSLFLKATKESVIRKNIKLKGHPRWFEDPFRIDGEEFYLTNQWNGTGEYSLSLSNLNFFLRKLCKNDLDGTTYVVKKIDEKNFALVQNVSEVKIGQEESVLDREKNDEGERPVNDKYAFPRQKILFGAPGTGKSFKIDDPEKGYGLKDVDEARKFRSTFHPDYDYAQFVGAYKPKKESGGITYSFVPQVFAKAYVAAWKLYLQRDSRDSIVASPFQNDSGKDIQVYLVIEEINRGNCAQIFGDIFQLLDRDSDGFSQYAIDADCDFADWLKTDGLASDWDNYIADPHVKGGKIALPPNLNILATMNTSDQSLFPMDSAFKRRFDWEYVPISFDGKDAANYQIDIDGSQYSWQNFVETVNAKILDLTESEDKQLGEFFIKPDSGNVISKERFLGKVMFYLWNEVCKDEHKNGSFFCAKINDKKDFFTFQDLYKKKDLLKLFMDGLLEDKPTE